MGAIKFLLLTFGLTAVMACGGEEPLVPEEQPPQTYESKAPTLHVVSPGELKVGESLVILGQDFIDPLEGYSLIAFRGTYFDDKGERHPVDLKHKANFVNSGKLSWKLWPYIVFHPKGDRLGYFLGTVEVINTGADGIEKASTRLQTRIDIRPSLIPREVRPANASCQPVVSGTNEDTPFGFRVEAVGLREGTQDAPLTFYWGFMAEQWQVSMTHGAMDPSSVFPKQGGFMLEDQVTEGSQSSVSGNEKKTLVGRIWDDSMGSLFNGSVGEMLGYGKLVMLRTGKISSEASSFLTMVSVKAVDASGKSTALTIPVTVSRIATMEYDGIPKVVERFAPVLVSDCIPGGDIGRNVTYTEDKAETRVRSMSFQYNANMGVNFAPYPAVPFALGINFSLGFGVDTSATLSSSHSSGLNMSGQVLPGQYGVFYRQTSKLNRVGRLIANGLCGQTGDLGYAVLTDWMFTPELATGPTCIPPSNLKAYE